MVYAPTSLKSLTIADLSNIQIIHQVKDRPYGRRFKAVYQSNGVHCTIEDVVFHQLYRRAKKLAKDAIRNQKSTELDLVKSFSMKLLHVEIEAIKDYKQQGYLYKIRTAFHRFFGATPLFGSHEKRVQNLAKKLDKKIPKFDVISDKWLETLENVPKTSIDVDILEKSRIFQTDICPMFRGENQTAKLVEHDNSIESEINAFAKRAHTLIDTSVNKLLSSFLENKLSSGSLEEKAIYQDMTVEDFVKRLLSKRPLSISPLGDATIYLRNKTTVAINSPLPLDDYLSDEEMQVSAFLVTATPTHFINHGEFPNVGQRQDQTQFERKGIYYGISGARLSKQDLLEEELVYIKPDRMPQNFYTWVSFFHGFLPFFMVEIGYNENPVQGDYFKIANDCYLDKIAYKRIMEVRISAFLKDADNQARTLGKKAYLHVIPLGLEFSLFTPSLPSALKSILSEIQKQIYIEQIKLHKFVNIDTLNFSQFPGVKQTAEEEPIESIKVLSSMRNTADKLDDANLLLCAQYESHPGSFPGNGYWKNCVIGEGTTPVLCSTIAELANPYINENISNLFIYK